MLRRYQHSDLQRKTKTLNALSLLQSLSNIGQFSSARMNDRLFVVKLVDYAGKVMRAFAENLADAIRNLAYNAFCSNGSAGR